MIELRPYQSDLITDIRTAFTAHRSCLMVLPTGGGKTVCFSYLAQQVMAKGKRVYILVHRDELIDQVSKTLTEFGVTHGFVAANRPTHAFPVMVCSVFTLVNRWQNYHAPDLIIIDEAHHATSKSTWGRVLNAWPKAYRLGVTATPIRLDGKDLAGSFECMVEGPSVADLMGNGDLCSYKLYAPPVVLGQLRMRMGDFVKSDITKAMDKPTITGDAVSHYAKLAPHKRAIVFCASVEHTSHVADQFASKGWRSAQIDGSMDRAKRRDIVRRFTSGDIQVLTSCDLVSEGFDLPAIECAILLRPTASLGLYLQQVGRALRRFPGKEQAIILDHAGNAGRHGLPDDDREWTLGEDTDSGRKKKKPVTTVRTCGRCYAAARPGAMVCAECGWEWPAQVREVEEKAGELEEVAVERAKIEARKEVGKARSFQALQALEAARGYKPGWAQHVWASRANRR